MEKVRQQSSKKQLIINSAIAEFGAHSYNEASVNTITKNGNFSKGLIYHYFENKDALYLACVSECFEKFVSFLKINEIIFDHVEKATSQYISMRQEFFKQNPKFSNIFANALFHPPDHLKKEIKEIKSELNQFNNEFYRKILENIVLKDYVNVEEAMEYFTIFQESFNYYFQTQDSEDYDRLVQEHEIKLEKILKMMFYGIIKEEKQ